MAAAEIFHVHVADCAYKPQSGEMINSGLEQVVLASADGEPHMQALQVVDHNVRSEIAPRNTIELDPLSARDVSRHFGYTTAERAAARSVVGGPTSNPTRDVVGLAFSLRHAAAGPMRLNK